MSAELFIWVITHRTATSLAEMFHADLTSITTLYHVYSLSPLQSERILKIGTNLRIDDAKLKRHFNVHLRGVLDLAWSDNKILRRNTVFRKPFGIRQLVQRLLRKEMVKEGKWTTSDWERRPLKRQQVEYAALDVYAPFMVYEKMKLLENKQESAPPTEDLASVDTLQRNEVTGTNTA